MHASSKKSRSNKENSPKITRQTSRSSPSPEQSPHHSSSTHSTPWSRRNKITKSPLNPEDVPGPPVDVKHLFNVKQKKDSLKNLDNVSVTNSDLSEAFDLHSELSGGTTGPSVSYKDRIRDRFRAVKSRAGISNQKVHHWKKVEEKVALDRLRKETQGVDNEVEAVRTKYNLIGLSRGQSSVDFFLNAPLNSKNDIQTVDEEPERKDDELLVYCRPQFMREELLKAENENCYYVKSSPVPMQEKISTSSPRRLQQEGFFVEEIKNVSKHHLNMIEKRLLEADDTKWFDCKGDLDILPNPITKTSIRPEFPEVEQKVVTYMPASTEEKCEEVVIVRENILEVAIGSIKFTHHSLFSIEHVLAQRLFSCYEIYKNRIESNSLQRLSNQLCALRQVKRNVENLQKQSGDSDRSKLTKYYTDIKSLRNLLLEEGKLERDNLKTILNIWKIIKKIRGLKEYSSTRVKLLINKEKVNYLKEQNDYEANLEETMQEIMDEMVREYKDNMKVYKEELQKYKERKPSDIEEVSEGKNEDEDAPKKPIYDVDEEQIRMQLKKQFLESFRHPGEPIIKILLTNDNQITTNVNDIKEAARRQQVANTRIQLRVICNNLEVCRSEQFHLNEDFVININDSYSILLSNIPQFLTLEIIEQTNKSLLKKRIYNMQIELPSRNVSSDIKKELQEPFEKLDGITHKHSGVGCGSTLGHLLEPHGIFNVDCTGAQLNFSGAVFYGIAWDKMENDANKLEQISGLIDEIVEKTGAVNVAKLTQFLNQNAPDPQDPKNAILYEFSRGYEQDLASMYLKKKDYFRLDPYLKGFTFCDPSEIENNLRLTVLQLRDQNEIEFDGMNVPNRVKEIPLNILSDYKRRMAIQKNGIDLHEEVEGDVNLQRSFGMKYLRQVHTRVFQKCKSTQNNLQYEDVVDEKYLAYFQEMVKAFLAYFINWFRWQPKIMQPLPQKLINKQTQEDVLEASKKAHVLITILQAKNLPKRLKAEGTARQDSIESLEVRPFVKIFYNEITLQSSTSSGCNPEWNESLRLPLESHHMDYLNPKSLSGSITVSLFDEIEEGEVNRWMGSVNINLSAISHGSSMSGFFKVRLPYMLFGYETEQEKPGSTTPRALLGQTTTANWATYLEMKITMHPNIPKLSPSLDELPCSDLPYIKDHIVKWNDVYNSNFPQRKFFAMAIDTNAKTTCLIRYIRPLEPPQINTDEFDVTPDQCARYISMIPFTDCNHFYQNVWLTTEQLLHLMIGSVVDHAVALTCFLLALQLDVWLLLGYGIPHGSTAYVLVQHLQKEPGQLPTYYIYDVVYNEKYDLTDPHCPLQRIYCIANQENLWANTQRNDNIPLTRFDLTRRSDWLPLFNDRIRAPMNSINMEISYREKFVAENLEAHLLRKIKKKIGKVRHLESTIWNLKVSSTIRNALKMCELNTMYSKGHNETLIELSKLSARYQINGFISNIPFMSVASLVQIILNSGIHLINQPGSEFALAIYVHMYSGQLLSLWVFLANISSK